MPVLPQPSAIRPSIAPKAAPAGDLWFLGWLPESLQNENGLMVLAGAGVVILAGIVFAVLTMTHVI